MINSPAFKLLEQTLIASHKQNGWEYGANYYGNDKFSDLYTSRLTDRVEIYEYTLFSLFNGWADVITNMHDGRVAEPGLSMSGYYNDIKTSESYYIPIMATIFNLDGIVDRYCCVPKANN